MKRTARIPLNDVSRHATAGTVDYHRARRPGQHPIGRQRHRQLLADVATRLVDDRQAVGVGVLGKPDAGPVFEHRLAESSEVLLERLRRMSKLTIGCPA